jgi:hypothetical protein
MMNLQVLNKVASPPCSQLIYSSLSSQDTEWSPGTARMLRTYYELNYGRPEVFGRPTLTPVYWKQKLKMQSSINLVVCTGKYD